MVKKSWEKHRKQPLTAAENVPIMEFVQIKTLTKTVGYTGKSKRAGDGGSLV